jgi:hypothetical protein
MPSPASAQPQLPVPRLNSVFPCGAQRGTEVEVTVSGAELDGATGLYFSQKGLTAKPVPPDPKDANKNKGKFLVSVAADVPVGPYDVRVVTAAGASNFRAFLVGDVPEYVEKEDTKKPNNEFPNAERVAVPVVVNGRMNGGTDVDHYVFAAKKGQRLIINCWAWRIDSRLDATMMLYDGKGRELAYSGDFYGKDPFIDFTVPEDGDYVVKVWDFIYDGGSDLFYRLHIGATPHIDAVLPAAVTPGRKNTLTVYGRNLPGGKPAPGWEVAGRPLEMITREVDVPADPERLTAVRGGEAVRPTQALMDGFDFRISAPEGTSNAVFIGYAADPILLEKEPNDDAKTAQRVEIPCDVTGTFSLGDRDTYAFKLKKGERIVAEVFGERQCGLADPMLIGFDPAGKRLVAADDRATPNIGQIRFTTNTRDGRWDFTAPTDGEYTVQVRDLYFQQRGDPRFTYRLNIRRPRPDFRLYAVPSHDIHPDCAAVGKGGRTWMDILLYRNDGFDGPVRVEAVGLPAGVSCDPVVVAPGKNSAPLVFHAAADAKPGVFDVRIVGKAEIDGAAVARIARGGGLTWPTVNTPGVARMSDSIVLAVRERNPYTVTASLASATAAAGTKVAIKVKIDRAADWAEAVQLSGFELPPGASVGLVTVAKGATEGTAELTLPANAKPGTYGFCLHGAGQVARDYANPPAPPAPATPIKDKDGKEIKPAAAPEKKPAGNMRIVLPSNALTLTVEPAAGMTPSTLEKPGEKKPVAKPAK